MGRWCEGMCQGGVSQGLTNGIGSGGIQYELVNAPRHWIEERGDVGGGTIGRRVGRKMAMGWSSPRGALSGGVHRAVGGVDGCSFCVSKDGLNGNGDGRWNHSHSHLFGKLKRGRQAQPNLRPTPSNQGGQTGKVHGEKRREV